MTHLSKSILNFFLKKKKTVLKNFVDKTEFVQYAKVVAM